MNKSIRNTIFGIVAGTVLSANLMAQNPVNYPLKQEKQQTTSVDSLIQVLQKEIKAANKDTSKKDAEAQPNKAKSNNTYNATQVKPKEIITTEYESKQAYDKTKPKKFHQFYAGSGFLVFPYNKYSKYMYINNVEKIDGLALLGQLNAGIKWKHFSLGGLFGYRNNFEENIEKYFMNGYGADHVINEITQIKNKMFLSGLQAGYHHDMDTDQEIGFLLGIHYNTINSDSTITKTFDGIDSPPETRYGQTRFFTWNTSIEARIFKNVAIDLGFTWPLQRITSDLQDAAYAANLNIKIYFGK